MHYLAQYAQPTPDPTAVMAGLAAMSGVILIIALVSVAFTVLIYYFIFKKTGMNPWLSLLMLVPLANFVMLLILAFSEWPVSRENAMLRAQLAGAGGAGIPPGGGYGPGPGYGQAPTPYGTQLPPPGSPPVNPG
jgi:uncharacterized membrane protein